MLQEPHPRNVIYPSRVCNEFTCLPHLQYSWDSSVDVIVILQGVILPAMLSHGLANLLWLMEPPKPWWPPLKSQGCCNRNVDLFHHWYHILHNLIWQWDFHLIHILAPYNNSGDPAVINHRHSCLLPLFLLHWRWTYYLQTHVNITNLKNLVASSNSACRTSRGLQS
jgi:hypothetical protein